MNSDDEGEDGRNSSDRREKKKIKISRDYTPSSFIYSSHNESSKQEEQNESLISASQSIEIEFSKSYTSFQENQNDESKMHNASMIEDNYQTKSKLNDNLCDQNINSRNTYTRTTCDSASKSPRQEEKEKTQQSSFRAWLRELISNVKTQKLTGVFLDGDFCFILFYLVFMSTICLFFGIVFLVQSTGIVRTEIRYDTICSGKNTCEVEFSLPKNIENPFIYYRIENFFANHRNFIKSKSYKQLRGSGVTLSDCSPIKYNSDVGSPKSIISPFSALDLTSPAYPCGLMPKYMFNDTFLLSDSSGNEIKLSQDDIALYIDKNKFKNSDNLAQQWKDFTDQSFMVWSRIDIFSEFEKLYAKSSMQLNANQKYKITITNNYSHQDFDLVKKIVVSSTSSFGHDIALGIIFTVGGGFVAVILIPALCILEYIKWSKQVTELSEINGSFDL